MGVILNATLDFKVIVNVIVDVVDHALGAIINKYKKFGGLGTMYSAGDYPVLDYAPESLLILLLL